MTRLSLLFFVPLWLKRLRFARSAASSRTSATAVPTFATRRDTPLNPLHSRHFSGLSRAIRRHKMSIQRQPPSHPPATSADKLQNLQQMCIFRQSAYDFAFNLAGDWRLIADDL